MEIYHRKAVVAITLDKDAGTCNIFSSGAAARTSLTHRKSST